VAAQSIIEQRVPRRHDVRLNNVGARRARLDWDTRDHVDRLRAAHRGKSAGGNRLRDDGGCQRNYG
jgi:hypothetical protein